MLTTGGSVTADHAKRTDVEPLAFVSKVESGRFKVPTSRAAQTSSLDLQFVPDSFNSLNNGLSVALVSM